MHKQASGQSRFLTENQYVDATDGWSGAKKCQLRRRSLWQERPPDASKLWLRTRDWSCAVSCVNRLGEVRVDNGANCVKILDTQVRKIFRQNAQMFNLSRPCRANVAASGATV
jgi:hypothetical protein